MSTKALNRALEILEAHGKLDGSKDAVDAAATARAELAAIERAAKVVGAWPAVVLMDGSSLDENARAHALMIAIAKDAP